MSVLKRAHKLTRAVWHACSAEGDTIESLATYMAIPTGTLKGWLGNAPNRHTPIAVVMALAEQNDPAVVWGPFVGADHIVVERPKASGSAGGSLVASTLGLAASSGEVSAQLHRAMADDEVDSIELAQLEQALQAHADAAASMLATIREQRRIKAVS